MATLRLEIVTPEAKAYSEDVEMVTFPGPKVSWAFIQIMFRF